MNKRIISITGEANSTMAPDICTITFTINKYNENYGTCVKELNEEVSSIISKLKKIKINRESLTSRDFNVRPYNIYDEDLKRYVFVEYRGEHIIDIKIDNEDNLINKVLNMLNDNEFTPKVSVSFGLKDESIIKENALKLAIEKARKDAQIIANGLGVNIGKVLDVKYNFDEREITRRRYDYLEDINLCEDSCDFNIMPEDCKFNERVDIIWEIE